jgi:hypothetical protein
MHALITRQECANPLREALAAAGLGGEIREITGLEELR